MKYLWTIILLCFLLAESVSAQGTSTGLIPLTDLKTGLYKGFQGGLYPAGLNSKPSGHDSLGLAVAGGFIALNIEGMADTSNGKIVLLSVGMSNTTQEFSTFRALADTFKLRNPKLIIVDGAQGGQTAAIISSPKAGYWDISDQRLLSSGVSPAQVEACWLKEADAQPSKTFPEHANILLNELVAITKIIKQRYPNCRIVYLSSRIYGGYATTALNPEPYAYEGGFAVKWLLEKQINQDTSLTCTGSNPKVPYLEWGPYLWADGLTLRSDGLIWKLEDLGPDGTHPSDTGRKKVAQMLLNFFSSSPTSRNWFLKNSTSEVRPGYSGLPSEFSLSQNFPNPFNPTTTITFNIQREGIYFLKLYDILGRLIKTLADNVFSAGAHKLVFDGGDLSSGIYYYQLSGGIGVMTRKMILNK